jgi:hypothetical protein
MTNTSLPPPYYPPGMPWPPPRAVVIPGAGANLPGYGQPGYESAGGSSSDTVNQPESAKSGGEVLSVEKTGGGKYIVRTQLPGAEKGLYKQSLMTEAEVKAAGGEIPLSGTWGQGAGTRWAPADTPTKESEARRELHKYDIPDEIKDYPENVKDAYQKAIKDGMDINKAVNDAIRNYNAHLERTQESKLSAQEKRYGESVKAAADLAQWEAKLKNDEPGLYAIYKKSGYQAYEKVAQKRQEYWEDDLRKQDEYLYKVYKEKGAEGYNEAVSKREKDIKGIFERNYITIGNAMMLKRDWEGLDQKYKDIAQERGFDAMYAQYDKDIRDYNEAIKQLRNYIVEKETSAVSERATTGKEMVGLEPSPGETYDIVKFLKDHPDKENILRDAGYKDGVIKDAKYFSKLNTAQLMWQGMTPWKEEKGERATLKGGAIMMAEVVLPGVYAARHWKELTPGEKAFTIAIDALTLVMFGVTAARVAGTAARAVGFASKTARLAAAAKALGKFGARQLVPVDLIIHPKATGRMAIKEIRNFAEILAHPRRISEPVITTASGQVMLKVSDFKTAKQAELASNMLMDRLTKGEQLFVKVGDTQVELTQSALMKQVKGSAAHATPDLTAFEKGLAVEWRQGKPIKEQGLFLSNEPVTQYVERGASGAGGIPLPTDASGKVEKVFYYKPDDIAKMDADTIRPIRFTDAKGIPKRAAPILENIAKKYNAKIAGSLNSYSKVPGAPRPNDIDLIFGTVGDARKALGEILADLKKAGFETQMHPTKRIINIKQGGKWVEAVDLWTANPYDKMIGGKAQPTRKINGFNVQRLGENYIHQSYGAIAPTSKAAKRTKSLERLAPELLKQLKKDGAVVRKPGIMIFNPETSARGEPTEKLFRAFTPYDIGWVKETETKLLTKSRTGEAGQKLWFRVGPNQIRAELWLEKPLKLGPADILKLKAAGILEDIKAPFKPAVKVLKGESGRASLETAGRTGLRGADIAIRAAGLTAEQLRILGRKLHTKGYITRQQFDNLLRAERVTRAAEQPRPLGVRARTDIQERLIRTIRATPERMREIERPRTPGGIPERPPMVPKRPQARVPPERPPMVPKRPQARVPPERPPLRPPERPTIRQPIRFPMRPPALKSDKEKRQAIMAAGGMAVAYQRGELGNKDVWHAWYQRPDTRELERVIIMGRAPEGARIEDGPKSAYRSIQTLFGKGQRRRIITEDTGAVDTKIEISGKSPQITFERDVISKGQQRISGKDERITENPPKIR